MQLLTQAQTFDDHDPDSTISITLIPTATGATRQAATIPQDEGGNDAEEEESESQAQSLYTALSACANLHPDPISGSEADADVDEDGGGGQRPAIMFDSDGDVGGVHPLGDGGNAALGLPPPMPGSGGWITAENVGEFFDEEGNWRGEGGLGQEGGVGVGAGGGLGEGAGTVRSRVEDGDGEDVEGEGGEMEETKWRRTD